MGRLVSWLRTRLPLGGESDSESASAARWNRESAPDWSDDEGGFLMSRLDASVLLAHGFGSTAAERELGNVQEKAKMLEEARQGP